MACQEKQNFCSSGCQTAGEHSEIFCENQTGGFKFSKSSEKGKKAVYNFINEAIDAIKKIGNYGKHGTKQPSADELKTLKTVSAKQKIDTSDFNQLLTVLKITNKDVKKKQRLLGSYMDDLENYINNFELNENLCDECNESCQSGQGGGDCGESGCTSAACLGGICAPLVECSGCNTGVQNCSEGGGCPCHSAQGCATAGQCAAGCLAKQ